MAATRAAANVPGGGTGSGPAVTLSDNGGTVTIANGIISILCTKSGATIDQINYIYNNGGVTVTNQLLAGGHNGTGGQLYWELGGFGGGTFTYSLVADPAANGGNYAEIQLLSSSASSGTMEAHFSVLRGSTGFYVTAIWSHRSVDAAMSMGETRDNIYAGAIFNWMSVDATRNRLMQVQANAGAVGVFGAPIEVSLWTNGIYQGQYEDKYKYSGDFGTERVWGWSSVGAGGSNVGLWNVSASAEYYGGGPMKRELLSHIGTTILNMTRGSHYGGGTDSSWAVGELWTHLYGPYFIYCNNLTNSITNTNQAAQALYNDALAQAAAEQTAWPYAWFTNANFATASARGAVTGRMAIADTYNPNASASALWVGLVQQPLTSSATYDFQKWMKPYQFWAKTDASGNFTIPNVIAGANYTLYAFGPGAAGTFQSQSQSGGSAPNTLDIPAAPFSVTVAAGATNHLGVVTWTPTRVGPTVFEIGYPDRTGAKFRHGADWWVGDIGPSPANPSPIWSKFLEYPFDFPNGPTYVVGQSRWTTDWNYVQPIVSDLAGNYNGSISTITFNLASPPGASASLYLALSSDFQGPLAIQVNGTDIAGSGGYFPAYSGSADESDATIREGIHGMFSDNRITFSGSLLQQGQNTITLNMRKGGYFSNHAMYDYIRLELTGYVPPAPSSLVAYPGNNRNLICWPAVPGATSYNILRSTTPGTGYVSITNGVLGPVCGSGTNNAVFLDITANNGTTYYYIVQSVNPLGASPNSTQSAAATPSASFSSSPPLAPAGLSVASSGHQNVSLSWSPSAGANYYSVYRSTLLNNGGGASNVLDSIILNNTNTSTSFTDTSPTDGSIYSYYVRASSAAGTSDNSAAAVAVPLPAPPAGAPASFSGAFVQSTSVFLSWTPVYGAVGYIIRRAASTNGPYNYVMSVTETNYSDASVDPTTTYSYQVAAVNAAGVSSNALLTVFPPLSAPASLSAVPGDSQVFLSWPPVPNAAGYLVYSGLSSGNEQTVVVSGYAGTTYTNAGLANGTTYYYVVAATNATGSGPNSPEASATPSATITSGGRNLVWKGDGSANIWDLSGAVNWQTNGVPTVFTTGDTANFDDTGSNNVPVSLVGNLQPSLVNFTAARNYIWSGNGSISGTNALVKSGSGSLTINNTNTYSGGTFLNSGATFLGNVGANSAGLGSSSITFNGGTLVFNGYTGSTTPDYGGNSNPLIIPAGNAGAIYVPQRFLSPGLAGPLSGSGLLILYVTFVRGDISGNWSNFFGQISVNSGGGADFRVANANGFPNAKLSLNSAITMYSRTTSGAVIPIGEFSAVPTAVVAAGGGSSLGVQNAVTWRVGALNTSVTNAAIFSGTVALIKEGSGTWTLTGQSTTTGSIVVSNGLLLVNGSLNGSPVTVNGGWLGGAGFISGAPVTVNSGGSFAPGPGNAGIGLITISNSLTLAAGSATYVHVQHSPLTNSAARVSGALTEGGTLVVTNSGATPLASGDSFQLFNAGSYSGAFGAFALPPLDAGLVWNTNLLKTSGLLSVAAYFPPLIQSFRVSSGSAVITGSGGIAGWTYYLLASSNLVAAQWTPVATNQFDANGNFTITNAIDIARSARFFRLQLQ